MDFYFYFAQIINHVASNALLQLHSSIVHFQEDDITKMLAASTHIGSSNSEKTMEKYVFKRKTDGINIINLKRTWEKVLLAARAIASVENPADVYVCGSRPFAQRSVLKFSRSVKQ